LHLTIKIQHLRICGFIASKLEFKKFNIFRQVRSEMGRFKYVYYWPSRSFYWAGLRLQKWWYIHLYMYTHWSECKVRDFSLGDHLRLTSSTTTFGDRRPRKICKELTFTALPGNQFTMTPQKTSVAKQKYTQFDTITPPPPRGHTPNFLYCLYLLSQNNF